MTAPKPVIVLKVPAAVRKVFEPIEEAIFVRSKIKVWAMENAYTLIFLSAMFIVTWVGMVVSVLWK